MPLARTRLSYATRIGVELFQCLFQSAAGAHAAALLGSGQSQTLRPAELDDHRTARVVHRLSPVRHQALFAADQGSGETFAPRRRAPVSVRVSGESSQERLILESPKGLGPGCRFLTKEIGRAH